MKIKFVTTILLATLIFTILLPITANAVTQPVLTYSSTDSSMITLNESLISENSQTTRIDQMTKEELKEVKNFTIDIVGKNKVVFNETLDLSSDETIKKLNKLSEYINFSTKGKVTIDTEYLDFLNKPATITMYGLSFTKTPLIYKNGKLATKDEVSNVVYVYSQSKKSGTLTFNVTSFSTYEVRAQETDASLSISQEQLDKYNLSQMLLLIGLITLQGIVVAVVVKLIEKKRLEKGKKLKSKEKRR